MIPAKRPEAETEQGAPDKSRPRRMINEKMVLQLVPISPTTLWRLERRGLFPKGTYISPNRKVWFEDEITAWQNGGNGRGRGRRHHPTRLKSGSVSV